MSPPEPTRISPPADGRAGDTTLSDNRTPGGSDTASPQQPPAHPSDLGASLPAVPGYVVSGAIARGGMGAVYAARDVALGRDVAVKVLLPGAGGDELARRFVREARIAARLPHPGIPPVHALANWTTAGPSWR